MNNIHTYEKGALFSLALLTAIVGMYSPKMISFLFPLITFIVIWHEEGIKNISLTLSPPLVFLFLLLTWIGMSIFWAENKVEAIKVFTALTITFIFFSLFLSCLLRATPSLISKAYTIVIIAGLFLMLLILFQIFIDTFLGNFINYKGLPPYMLRIKPTGSILGLITFVGCAFLWIYNGRILSIFTFIILFLLISLTLCQTAIYSIILGSIIFCLSYFMPRLITRMEMIFSYTFLLISPILYTYVISSSTAVSSPYLKWFMNRSFFHRFLAWEYYSKKFFEKPFLGWGAESSRYLPTEPNLAKGFKHLLHPHNNSIQAYSELGLVGGILYALFFSSLFYIVEKYIKDRLSVAVCNATLTFGFLEAEITHNAWRNYWLSWSALTAGLIILFIKAREAQLHAQNGHSPLRGLTYGWLNRR